MKQYLPAFRFGKLGWVRVLALAIVGYAISAVCALFLRRVMVMPVAAMLLGFIFARKFFLSDIPVGDERVPEVFQLVCSLAGFLGWLVFAVVTYA